MDAAIAQKFQRTFGVADGPIRNRGVIDDNETEGDTSHHEQFKTGTVLMYGGQGKKIDTNNLIKNNLPTRTHDEYTVNAGTLSTTNGGLAQPLLEHTNKEVTGDDK